jgi:hypothetical protein
LEQFILFLCRKHLPCNTRKAVSYRDCIGIDATVAVQADNTGSQAMRVSQVVAQGQVDRISNFRFSCTPVARTAIWQDPPPSTWGVCSALERAILDTGGGLRQNLAYGIAPVCVKKG